MPMQWQWQCKDFLFENPLSALYGNAMAMLSNGNVIAPLEYRCWRCQCWSMFIGRSSKNSITNTAVGAVTINHSIILNTFLKKCFIQIMLSALSVLAIVHSKSRPFKLQQLRTAVSAVNILNVHRQILSKFPHLFFLIEKQIGKGRKCFE